MARPRSAPSCLGNPFPCCASNGSEFRQCASMILWTTTMKMDEYRREFLKMAGLAVIGQSVCFAKQPARADWDNTSGKRSFSMFASTAPPATARRSTPTPSTRHRRSGCRGGGTVLFPAGTYLCFSIHLKSNVHLHLDQGSTILAADSPKPGETTGYNGGTYDAAEPNTAWDAYQDYGHNHWHNSLIWGEDMHDLSITGPGLIWGKGLSYGRPTAATIRSTRRAAGVGNKAIALKNCRNVQLRDFSVLKGGHFGLLLTGVDNLTIDNLKIDTDRDGMDIDCCQNVRVSNCTVNSPWDDGICPKSSYALGYARATRQRHHHQLLCHRLLRARHRPRRHRQEVPDGQRARLSAPAASSAAPSPTAASSTSPSPTASSRAAAASRSRPSTARCSKTSPSPTSPCAISVMRPLFLRLGARLRGPRQPPKLARSSASSLAISQAMELLHCAHVLAAFRAT